MFANDPAAKTARSLRRHAQALEDDDYGAVIAAARDKSFILIGESTHGTAEFYALRAAITRALITHDLCDAVAVEADWPDAYRANLYVCNRTAAEATDVDAAEALSSFERFPAWMWRNTEVHSFLEWLQSYNAVHRPDLPCGFYGLDLYSMHASTAAVIRYLEKTDPQEAEAARQRYACLDRMGRDPQIYGMAAASGALEDCESDVMAQLMQIQKNVGRLLDKDDAFAGDDFFSARQNARVVSQAEAYYRALYRGHPNTWNLRDRHMFTTLESLAAYQGLKAERRMRIVVWAHNSHLGNAAATQLAERGEFNLGQLLREKYGPECLSIGLSTSRGTVTAASNWDGPAETKTVNPPLRGSFEDVFSHVDRPRFLLDLRDPAVAQALAQPRLERAIGVIYLPQTERHSHYFEADLPHQFDMLAHLETTSALAALPLAAAPPRPRDMDETYPYGI